jgi:hypothetical protein
MRHATESYVLLLQHPHINVLVQFLDTHPTIAETLASQDRAPHPAVGEGPDLLVKHGPGSVATARESLSSELPYLEIGDDRPKSRFNWL